jgi:protein-L-isoaspartate(D-aspartate) O-methyltransferase
LILPLERVYHLGCGVGYYTAIMAEVVGPKGSVVGCEVNPQLAARAKENLASYSNVTVVAGDGATFDPGECDAILINAGVTHPSPLWLDRLRERGRLVLPLTMATNPTIGIGVMVKMVRQHEQFSAEIVTSLAIYSCTSARDPQLEPLLRSTMTGGTLLKMKSVRRDVHEQSPTCLMHSTNVCLSSVEVG